MKFLKNILVSNDEKEELKTYESWFVKWESRNGEFRGDVEPEATLFTSKEEAEKFAKQLREAFKLIRHTSGTNVTITENT